jgi:hypothetical protein
MNNSYLENNKDWFSVYLNLAILSQVPGLNDHHLFGHLYSGVKAFVIKIIVLDKVFSNAPMHVLNYSVILRKEHLSKFKAERGLIVI